MSDQNRAPAGLRKRGVSRRQFLAQTAAGAALATGSGGITPAQAQAKTINIATFGGIVQDYLAKLYGPSFEAKTGIKVNFGANASFALTKLQNQSGGPAQWDLVSLSGAEYYEAIQQKLMVPFDYSIVDPTHIVPEFREPHGVKFSLFLFVMAWDQRQIPDDKAPQTVAEFWDTERFKGKRSLYTGIAGGGTLEMALLADGVPLKQLYPLDIDRALRSLERLGRSNIVWHTTNAEPIQQLASGAVPLANCFNGRAIAAARSGAPIGWTPAESGVMGNPYGVVASSANKKEAFELLNHMLNTPEPAAEYMKLTYYLVPNTEAVKLLPAEIADLLPTSPKLKDKVYIKDDAWWAANLTRATARFKEWQLGG